MKFDSVNPNLIAAAGVILAFVALIIVVTWQSNRSDANIADLRSEIRHLETRFDRLEDKIDSLGADLGNRVTDVELENVRLSERSAILIGMHGGSHPHQLEPDQP